MSNINQMTFKERNTLNGKSMQNKAEDATEECYTSHGYKIIPLGFNQMHRMDEEGFSDAWVKIPRILRNLPDMILVREKVMVVEVKGFYSRKTVNHNGALKMKVKDFKSYVWWDRILRMIGIPLYFNVYDLYLGGHYLVPFLQMNHLMEDEHRTEGVYIKNNEVYKEIHKEEMERYNVREKPILKGNDSSTNHGE